MKVSLFAELHVLIMVTCSDHGDSSWLYTQGVQNKETSRPDGPYHHSLGSWHKLHCIICRFLVGVSSLQVFRRNSRLVCYLLSSFPFSPSFSFFISHAPSLFLFSTQKHLHSDITTNILYPSGAIIAKEVLSILCKHLPICLVG